MESAIILYCQRATEELFDIDGDIRKTDKLCFNPRSFNHQITENVHLPVHFN